MSEQAIPPSPHGFELELGPQLGFYHRRSEVEILCDHGYSRTQFYGLLAFSALFGALVLSAPVIVLAKKMGVAPPIWKAPFWGPIFDGWYVACVLGILWFTCVLPLRSFLAIHEDGFVFQSRFRRHLIRYREIAACEAINSTAALSIVLADRTRLYWKGFYRVFPIEAAEQLLNLVESRKAGSMQVSQIDHAVKRRMHRTGIATGLFLAAIIVFAPVSNAKCLAVTHRVFGATFCGIPSEISVPILVAILIAPLVFVCPHLMIVLTVSSAAEIRRSLRVVIFGGIYLAIVIGAWIAFASMHGG